MAGWFFNVYRYAIVGVVYEILWLPMLLLLFLIPVLAILSLIRQKALFGSLSFYAGLLIVINFALLLLLK